MKRDEHELRPGEIWVTLSRCDHGQPVAMDTEYGPRGSGIKIPLYEDHFPIIDPGPGGRIEAMRKVANTYCRAWTRGAHDIVTARMDDGTTVEIPGTCARENLESIRDPDQRTIRPKRKVIRCTK